MSSQELSEEFWNRYFTTYDILNSAIPYTTLLEKISDSLNVKKGDVILEAGCGTGNLCVEMQKRGADVIGIDSNIYALKIFKEKNPSAKAIEADIS